MLALAPDDAAVVLQQALVVALAANSATNAACTPAWLPLFSPPVRIGLVSVTSGVPPGFQQRRVHTRTYVFLTR